MKTEILDKNNINKIIDLINAGEVVGLPTETVYGLAASIFKPESIKKIFELKGRPCDNPLIVHISEVQEVNILVKNFDLNFKKIIESFWPGPLTIVTEKSDIIIKEISAGLNTVAVRMPDNDLIRAVIKKTGPLAAPSANISGTPSPTSALHVYNDFKGKIPAVLDGGKCKIGLESTVIYLKNNSIKILRPGKITLEELESKINKKIILDKNILCKINNKKVISPGMKYKHYSPNAELILVSGSRKDFFSFLNKNKSSNIGVLSYKEDIKILEKMKILNINYGSYKNFDEQGENLFEKLREFNNFHEIEKIYTRVPELTSSGIAVYDRLLRASGFKILKI